MHFSLRASRIAPDAAVIPVCSCIILQKTRDHISSSPFLRRFSLPPSPALFFPSPLTIIPLRMILLLPVNSSTGDSLRPRTLLILRYFHHVYNITRLANLINFLNLRFFVYNGKALANSWALVRLLYLFAVLETVSFSCTNNIIKILRYTRSQEEREKLYIFYD